MKKTCKQTPVWEAQLRRPGAELAAETARGACELEVAQQELKEVTARLSNKPLQQKPVRPTVPNHLVNKG